MAYEPIVKIVVGYELIPRDDITIQEVRALMERFETILVTTADYPGNVLGNIWFRVRDIVPLDHLVWCLVPEWVKSDYTIAFDSKALKNDGAVRILIDSEDNRDIRDYVYAIHRVSTIQEAMDLIMKLEREEESY